MAFFAAAITVLQTLVVAIGAGLGIWGVINLLEGYGNDNPGANSEKPACGAVENTLCVRGGEPPSGICDGYCARRSTED